MRAQPLSIFLSLFCLYTTPVLAIVIRHDVAEEQYLVQQAPPAMIDMPHEGHGMLIAPEWVVTAGHVIFYDYKGKGTIRVGDAQHEIDYIIFHPGYSKPGEGLFTGDSARSQAYLRTNHDIALIKQELPWTRQRSPAWERPSWDEGSDRCSRSDSAPDSPGAPARLPRNRRQASPR